MKHEYGTRKPDCLVEDWPGKYTAFSWLEYVVTLPNPIILITTLKENGLPNANLHSWQLFLGEKDRYYCLIAILNHHHTYTNIMRDKEWCVNVPSFDALPSCSRTISNNGMDDDEILKSGFTVEASKCIKAPRIKECGINLECMYEWSKPLFEGSIWTLFAGRVEVVAVDDKVISATPEDRMQKMALMYNIRSTVNPVNGEYYGPNTFGLINRVVRTFPDDGSGKA
jgi:flavin reductase (DIM6/NTAB) family NADH-FMN oxidoreductase RutF